MGCHVAKYWAAGSSCTPLLGSSTSGWGLGWLGMLECFWGLLGRDEMIKWGSHPFFCVGLYTVIKLDAKMLMAILRGVPLE